MKYIVERSVWRNNTLHTDTLSGDFEHDSGVEDEVINLYPDIQYQTFEGFGGAVTDAAGYVYSKLDDEQKKRVVQAYFGKAGAGYQAVRVPIDSCDFSLEHYQALDCYDSSFTAFNMERNGRYIFPLLSDIQAAAGHPIPVMLSPWSPPPFAKTNNERNHGGSLKKEYYSFWAKYLCRFIKEFEAKGFRVEKLSIQNEPKAVQTWDSCVYTAKEERDFLADALYPALCRNDLAHIQVYIWDHNKERLFERVCDIVDAETSGMVAGAALHWYSGDHFEALQLVREQYPQLKLILSEACIEFCKYPDANPLLSAHKYAHDLIGNLNNGLNAFYDWNILLDSEGGPNHVANYCEAPIMFDTHKKELRENHSLRFIRHFSGHIQPGAKRIAFTRYTDELEITSFTNKDGAVVLVLLNRHEREYPVCLRIKGEQAKVAIAAQSIYTVTITN